MRRLAFCMIGLVAGYALGAALGFAGVALLSTNTHDKSLETVMTAAFVTGPIGAVLGFIAGLLRPQRPR